MAYGIIREIDQEITDIADWNCAGLEAMNTLRANYGKGYHVVTIFSDWSFSYIVRR